MNSLSKAISLGGILLATTALPALAQDGLCGGIGANGQWIGGAEGASDISTAANYQEQMALVLGGNEYVALFSVSAPTEVRVEAAGRGGGDPIMDLYDATGAILLSDDDSGGNGASRGQMMLDPGTYCVAMKAFDGAPMTGFVRVSRPEQEALTEGAVIPDVETGSGSGPCTAETSAAMLGDGPLSAGGASDFGSVDNNPYWRFTLGAPQAISITAENADADPLITLYDGAGTYLTENDDFDGLNSRIDMTTPLAPGDYCIGVQALSDTSLPITITVSEYDPVAAVAALYDRAEAAPPMDGSHPITDLGALTTNARRDVQNSTTATWFSFEAPEGGLVLIEAISAGSVGDPYVVLFDDLGRQIGLNDDFGSGLDSQLAARIEAGTYLIGLKDVNAETPNFVRMVVQRYVAAK